MDMSKKCISENTAFGVCLIQEGSEVGVGAPLIPENIGTLAHIKDWDMQQLGVLQIKTLGGARFQIMSQHTEANGQIIAEIKLLEKMSLALPAEFGACAEVLKMITLKLGAEHFSQPHNYEDAEWVGYRLAEVLPLKLIVKQKMLEINDAVVRLEILYKFLKSQGLAR
jgi:uncharacterized protein